ncbi:MAG: N-acetyl sugar amidotransferase [Deltaproteobacteria bacterium]|nr:N-acetyl sugar amidotransferase [Deltaproteobacteria bacterium]
MDNRLMDIRYPNLHPQKIDVHHIQPTHWSKTYSTHIQKSVQVCTRCVMDACACKIHFDSLGVCHFCKLHDKLERLYPIHDEGQRKLETILENTRKRNRGQKYDCIIGFSGGRDSTYLLYLLKKKWNLNPLAVHFNDGFDNPVAGENIKQAVRTLQVDLRTITSDWRQSKAIRIAFLKASVPNLEVGTDLGIFASLFSVAYQENIKTILTAHSFRTEGIAPLTWSYLDTRYLKDVLNRFSPIKTDGMEFNNSCYHLGLGQAVYYSIIKRIHCITPMFYIDYNRMIAEKTIQDELGWVNPGAHYFDDLYQSLISFVYRIKFNIDKRKFNYSALIRSGQMMRHEALERLKNPYVIEDPKILDLCIKRLGLNLQEFESFLKLSPKTFEDYKSYYQVIKLLKIPIWMASKLHVIPAATYDKFFNCS